MLCFQPASFCPCRDEMYDTASFQKTKRVHQNAPFYADTLRYQERKNVFSAHGWFRNCRYHFCYNFYGTSMKGYYRYYPNCSISQTFAFVYPFQSLFPLFLVCPSSIRRCSARREPRLRLLPSKRFCAAKSPADAGLLNGSDWCVIVSSSPVRWRPVWPCRRGWQPDRTLPDGHRYRDRSAPVRRR